MRLYWELLRLAVASGNTMFDFGRCTVGSGTYQFKRQWGAQPMQLYWHRWQKDNETTLAPAQDSRSKLGPAVRLWRRLPLPIANWLGPRISPRLPW
jgi:hypothetical protein